MHYAIISVYIYITINARVVEIFCNSTEMVIKVDNYLDTKSNTIQLLKTLLFHKSVNHNCHVW